MAAKKKEEKKKKTHLKTVEKLVDEISKLSVMELSELVNDLQDKLGVTAAPMAQAAPAAAGQGEETPQEAGAEGGGTLVLTGAGENKIAVIKALREINQNLGLKEAKDMTENLPAEIIKDGKAEEVKEASDKLKTAGATIEVK
jgi:large subunit ribosomal protein L7/L12